MRRNRVEHLSWEALAERLVEIVGKYRAGK
jgi:hypothetical protein